MPTVEQLERRLDGLRQLQSLVRNMKALSAVSIRQYEQAAYALADYDHTVRLGLHAVLRQQTLPVGSAPSRHPGPVAAVIFGSDHGLCGRVNEDLVSLAVVHLRAASADAPPPLLLAVGARMAARLEQAGLPAQVDYLLPGSAARIGTVVQQIVLQLDAWRSGAGVERVLVFHNHHLSTTRYRPTVHELLPLPLDALRQLHNEPWPARGLPTFDMAPQRLLSSLLRQYLFVSLCRACAESQASEHGSRLGAMRAAERNLKERAEEVGTAARLARQGRITDELLDVVAGFEALTARRSPGATAGRTPGWN